MKFGWCIASLALAAACAHAPRPQERWLETSVPADEGNAAIIVRYGPADAEIAQQVRRAVRVAVPIAERWGALSAPVTITIQPTHAALEIASGRAGHAWLRAWARRESVQLQSPRTWSRGSATDAQLEQLVTHELTHCAMYQAIGRDPRRTRSVPIWFREGMATNNARERLVAVDLAASSDRPLSARATLYTTGSTLLYASADRAFRLLVERYGEQRIRLLLERVRAGTDFADAFHDVIGIALDAFEDEFGEQDSQVMARGW